MIYLLPGMGADKRMYPAPWDTLRGCSVIEWPSYAGEKSLRELAARLAGLHSFAADSWIVGSSLGGMVALELSKLIPVQGVILVGSAQSPADVGPLLRLLTPLMEAAPLAFLQQLVGQAPLELTQMFRDSDPAFIRAMCRAIFEWEGHTDPRLRVHRIHGRHDLVIPLPDRADYVLAGGHLIAMTHAAECLACIREILAGPPPTTHAN